MLPIPADRRARAHIRQQIQDDSHAAGSSPDRFGKLLIYLVKYEIANLINSIVKHIVDNKFSCNYGWQSWGVEHRNVGRFGCRKGRAAAGWKV
jgi:hypothetical protein